MIPLRLALRNFMSYRDSGPPIDFAPLHTACLSGENGAGKSALLTAMTWALWGESAAHIADEDLIAQGETEMNVDFEFALGDQAYRVLRTRTRRGKTTTGKLTFQVHDPALGWRDISGDTVRQTQQIITARLRMDYDTFINSAFLRQGRADEFTTKNPTERKDILAKILGLDEYDRLAERARERARDREGTRRGLQMRLDELDARVARKAGLEQQVAELAEYLAEARLVLATAQAANDQAQLRLAGMEADRKALEGARGRAAHHESNITTTSRAIAELEARLQWAALILEQREVITAGYGRLQALRAQGSAWTERAHRHRDLQQQIFRLTTAVEAARNALLQLEAVHRRGVEELTRRTAGRADCERQLKEIEARLAQFAVWETTSQDLQQQRDGLQQEAAQLEGANEKLKEEADGIHRRLELLNEALATVAAAHGHGEVPCPLCGVFMDPVAQERVRTGYDQDIAARRQQWRVNKRRIDEVQQQLTVLDAQLAPLAAKLRERSAQEGRAGGVRQQLQGIAEAEGQLGVEQDKLAAVRGQLAREEYAAGERAELSAAQAQLAALAYDAEEHRRVGLAIQEHAAYEARFAELGTAAQQQEHDQAQLRREQEALAAHRAQLAVERAEEARLARAVAGLEGLRQEAAVHEQALEAAHLRLNRLIAEEGALQRELEQVAAEEAERAEKATTLQQVLADKGAYDDLARAFGKSGVQAMIIEQVVPELAEDANTLLGRMTDQRMHLAFETQRQAKTRDSTIETLDIKITDGAGVARKYEMFSGGEAFRINFAVRIALSKLLARRAGAQLQTLIIDEGFGTQDAQGRERLVQAIRSIQPDFEKILVITHLDELKDEFSSRIDVVKTPSGSIAMVN